MKSERPQKSIRSNEQLRRSLTQLGGAGAGDLDGGAGGVCVPDGLVEGETEGSFWRAGGELAEDGSNPRSAGGFRMTKSTRRLTARPSGVSFDATG